MFEVLKAQGVGLRLGREGRGGGGSEMSTYVSFDKISMFILTILGL